MPPPWEAWFALNPAQPPVLTRSQFRLCLVIQREFIGSLIRDWGEAFRVTFQFALPRSDRIRVLSLWDILRFDFIIYEFGIPRTEEDWGSIVRWGRRKLPHGRFQTSGILSSVVLRRP
jgi:hypothetical protein